MKRLALITLLVLTATPSRAEESAAPSGPAAVAAVLKSAWNVRAVPAYLSQWAFASPEDEQSEREFATARLAPAAGVSRLSIYAPKVGAATQRATAYGEIVTMNEPWGKIEQIALTFERRDTGWVVVGRKMLDQLEGLVHLTLDSAGYAAAGQRLHLTDFDLTMRSGTIFTSPEALGRTALVFVGDGLVHFRPRPPTEREQLRKYYGRPDLDENVKLAFVRLNPSDAASVLQGLPLEPDPTASTRWAEAQRFFEQSASHTYVMDAPVAGSPWWVIPPSGDSVVVFDYGHGPLTFSVNSTLPEGVSLFDRPRQRQICLYPLPGRPRDFDDSADRRIDVEHTDVRLTLDPDNDRLDGEASLRIAFLAGSGSIRLRLSEALTIDSVTSEGGRRCLFFRIRRQNTVVVALGALGHSPKGTITVRYHGPLKPPPFDREPASRADPPEIEHPVTSAAPAVYTQPFIWYPQAENDDFATASIQVDAPSDLVVVGPGERTTAPGATGRTISRLEVGQPVKQLALGVGRLEDGGRRSESGVTIDVFTVPRLHSEAPATLDLAVRIVRLFTQIFGPCAYHHISVVLMEAAKPGGHSPPGLVLLAERPVALLGLLNSNDPGNFSNQPGFFLAHEIAHQWWGDAVAPASYHDRWLSEAMAHYAAALWVRDSRGGEAFRNVMKDMERWAADKSSAGPVFLGHRLGHLEGDSRLFRAVVYDKGACVLDMVRRRLGEEKFRRALVSFQERYRFKKAGTPQLREAFESNGGGGLARPFEAWIYGTDMPPIAAALSPDARSTGWGTVETTIDGIRWPDAPRRAH